MQEDSIEFESYDETYEGIDKLNDYDEESDDGSWLSEEMYGQLRFLPPFIDSCVCGVNDQTITMEKRDWTD